MDTQDHSDKLQSLRAAISAELAKCPTYDCDWNLIKWLNGYNGDLSVIVPRLRQYLRYFHSMDMGNYRTSFELNSTVKRYYPFAFVGTSDKDGNLLHNESWGRIDMKGLTKAVNNIEFKMTRIYDAQVLWEAVRAQCELLGKNVGLCLILDLEDMDVSTLHLPLMGSGFTDHLQFFLDGFPELTAKLYVINAPPLFSMIFRLLTPFIAQRTQDKLKVFGSDYRAELLSHFDPANLPTRWGGTLEPNGTCGDDTIFISDLSKKFGGENFSFGGRIKTADLYDSKTDLRHPSGPLDCVTIYRGAEFYLKFGLKQSEKLSFWFHTNDTGSLGFGIYRLENSETPSDTNTKWDELEMSYPFLLVCSFNVPEWGQFVPKTAGTYVVRFSNQRSWIRSKSLSYNITTAYL